MAIRANLRVDQGADYVTTINVTDDDSNNAINLTGYQGSAQLRKYYTSATYYSFTVTIDGPAGEVTLGLSANTTNAITPGRYVYDCEVADTTGKRSRLIEGIVTITPQVTR